MTGVVIIGGGIAALECAVELRRRGYAGRLTLLSDEPMLPYERPPLSKELLGSADPQAPFLTSHEALRALDIDFQAACKVVRIDRAHRRVMTCDGRDYAYDQLVIATGARPRLLPAATANLAGVFYLRDWADAVDLRAALHKASSVVVLGAGVIGLEIAATALAMGLTVTVVEKERGVMSRSLPQELAGLIKNHLVDKGVRFMLGAEVRDVIGTDAIEAVMLQDGTRIAASVLVCGIGVCPRDDLAEAAGLAIANGILVDQGGRSSDPAIFAIGDVACWGGLDHAPGKRHETYNDAIAQAHILAAGICGQGADRSILSTFWSDQADLHIQGAGEPHGDAVILRRRDGATSVSCLVLRGCVCVGAFSVNAGADFSALRRLIGRHISQDMAQQISDPQVQLRSLVRDIEKESV